MVQWYGADKAFLFTVFHQLCFTGASVKLYPAISHEIIDIENLSSSMCLKMLRNDTGFIYSNFNNAVYIYVLILTTET